MGWQKPWKAPGSLPEGCYVEFLGHESGGKGGGGDFEDSMQMYVCMHVCMNVCVCIYIYIDK